MALENRSGDFKIKYKLSNCKSWEVGVDYLGHLILGTRVKTDLTKILSMLEWPVPTSLKSLRGFLGLTGYCKKFIKGYGFIAAPLTSLSKKNFEWIELADTTFVYLKQAITQPSVLRLPDFSKAIIVGCDVSGTWSGVVLMQEGQPIAYIRKTLKGRTLLLFTYEEELLALVIAV